MQPSFARSGPEAQVSSMTTAEFWMMVAGLGAFAIAGATLYLAFIARTGLAQIGVSRHEIKTRSQREAIAEALARCEDFRLTLVKEIGEVNDAFAVAKKTPLIVTVRFGEISAAEQKLLVDWVDNLPAALYNKCIHVMNHLEAFAMAFTTRLADASIAYTPLSDVFCRSVIQYYPLIVYTRQRNGRDLYSNVAKLYEDWAGKKTAADLQVQAQRLQEKYAETVKRINLDHLPPLGTD
jgi:hypothetical protein